MSSTLNTVLNWSSGKDAALAFHLLSQQDKYKVTHLLTTLSEEHNRVFMHGVREKLLYMQAERMGLPLTGIKLPASPGDDLYKNAMRKALLELKGQGIATAAFGDIFLDDLRKYREGQLEKIGIKAIFPLWKQNTRQLVQMIEETGIEAIIVCVNEKYLSKEFLGRKINASFLCDLPANVDACGENGEFHTFVYNAPFFKEIISITTGDIIYKKYIPASITEDEWDTGFYFLDVDTI